MSRSGELPTSFVRPALFVLRLEVTWSLPESEWEKKGKTLKPPEVVSHMAVGREVR